MQVLLGEDKNTKAYHRKLVTFMRFKDNTEYDYSHNFSEEELLQIAPSDICDFFSFLAYGTRSPGPKQLRNQSRRSNLGFYKKAISRFMPRRSMGWDPVHKIGNPTKSDEVNGFIRDLKRLEGRGQGAPSKAVRHLEWMEFNNVLKILTSFDLEKNLDMVRLNAVIRLQWHLCCRFVDMIKMRFVDFSHHVQINSILMIGLSWSKSISEVENAPRQLILPASQFEICPIAGLAIYFETFGRKHSRLDYTPFFIEAEDDWKTFG